MNQKKLPYIVPVTIEIRVSQMPPGQIGLFAVRRLKPRTIIARTNGWANALRAPPPSLCDR